MQTLYMIGEATREVLTRFDALLLLAVLAAAVVVDVRSYRIPNVLTVPAMVAGVLAHTLASASAWSGLGTALAGLASAIVILIPLHAMRLLGAGDVKLMAVVGAFVGAPAILPAILFVLVAGGLVAVAYAAFGRVLSRALTNIASVGSVAVTAGVGQARAIGSGLTSAGRIPYAISITLGTSVFLVLQEMLS